MKYCVFDFETFSRADLLKIGAWKYASDFSTGILCMSMKVITEGKPSPTRSLSEQQLHALDTELMELCNDPEVIFVATTLPLKLRCGSFTVSLWAILKCLLNGCMTQWRPLP